MVQIEQTSEWQITAADEQKIADLLALCFGTDFGGRTYYQQRHHVRFVAREGGKILGHMALCYRDVRLGGQLTSIWGLAEVATDPMARGNGIATQMLHAAVAFVRTTPAQFFLLFGNRPMYAGNGFVSYPNTITYVALDGAKTGALEAGANDGLMVLSLADQSWAGDAHLDLLGHKF